MPHAPRGFRADGLRSRLRSPTDRPPPPQGVRHTAVCRQPTSVSGSRQALGGARRKRCARRATNGIRAHARYRLGASGSGASPCATRPCTSVSTHAVSRGSSAR
ncbi:hypothetical protein GCM10011354_10480 [Egicoccus halophilus]|uniref:Uncharacterized protein n=1 Tax=Egicoccus halophilus TaxID=1670830 RepID=A0A8J3AC33_9ACTN|nr:hypothetical protein GCM10011354_10480 [Egicoccus halophilus]